MPKVKAEKILKTVLVDSEEVAEYLKNYVE
jgi:hypothetical protein